MASCSGIVVKSISDGKVYLKGTISGLSSSKHYCLHYFSGDWKNMPNKSLEYTYFKNKTTFDLSAAGCHIPESDLDPGVQFEVRCHEISGTCEDRIASACSKILSYEVTETRVIIYRVEDENGNAVQNARIECFGEVLYTGSDGRARQELETGTTYYASCYAPTDYECSNCYESFYHDSDAMIDFDVKKEEVQCLIDVRVPDQNGTGVAGARVKIPGALGAAEITTNMAGTATGFTLVSGQQYTMNVSHLPSAWETTSESLLTFTPQYNQTFSLYVHKKDVRICTEGEKRNPTTCGDGSTIYKEVCHNNAWITSGETCPTKPECKEGDKKAGYICEGGKWVAYTPPVVPPVVPPVEPPVTPPVTPPVVPPKYLTPEQANERVRAGLPCYIKCTLPILNMLPAISYTQGAWVLPFFTITSEP